MAVVANDIKLQSIIKSGKDLYTMEAIEYFNLDPNTTKKTIKGELRQAAKIVRLARQYWAQEKTCFSQAIAQDRRMTITKMQGLIRLFDKTYSDTVKYWHTEKALVARQGYSEDRYHGRRRVYPRMPDDSEIVNWPVQATAAAIMNDEFVELDARLEDCSYDTGLQGQLHDAFDVECDEDDVDKVIPIILGVTDRNYVINEIDFNFGVDLKVAYHSQGDTWAAVA
jgi:DNA polymerase I-like protein with 3'-5' exonuclease and polymerase domains